MSAETFSKVILRNPVNQHSRCMQLLSAHRSSAAANMSITMTTASACSSVVSNSAHLLSYAVGLFGQCASLAAHEMSPLCKGQAVQIHCLAPLGHAFCRVHGTCSQSCRTGVLAVFCAKFGI